MVLKELRRAVRRHSGRAMAVLFGRQAANTPLEAAAIRSVVVVRANGRMGNTLFLTPLLTALADVLPHATFDVVSMYPEAAELLHGLPRLRRVMVLPHKGWWHLDRSLDFLRSVRGERYDLAIDPAPDSFSSRMWLSICRARYRLGFGSGNQWARLTHDVDVSRRSPHLALEPLALLERLPPPTSPPAGRLNLPLDGDELAAGRRRLSACLDSRAADRRPDEPVVGFFAHARGRKDLGLDWWRRFWKRLLALEPGLVTVEVLPAPAAPPVLDGRPALHVASTRHLAATMAGMQAFLSADTGPMHLASATAVPVIALFGPTDPERFGPLKPADTVIRIDARSPEAVAEECHPVLMRALAAAAAARAVPPR